MSVDAVAIRARCALPELLIERALHSGIRFSAVAPRGRHALDVTLNARDAARFLALCERFSIPAEVRARRGGSAAAQWLKGRWTVLVGLLLGIAACWLFLGRLWVIDIRFTGDAAARGDPAALRSALDGMGVAPGVSRRLDTAALSDALTAGGDYSYVGARVEGVRLFIEAAPEIEAPEVYDVEAPRSLYADRSGIVASVNVESGEACVKPGDAVHRGQLLIRGEEKVSREETRPIAALGQVMLRAWFEGSAEGRTTRERPVETGRRSASAALVTPWFEIPITEGEAFPRQVAQIEDLPIGGLYAPARLRRVIAKEIEIRREAVDPALLEARLAALALADARYRLSSEGPREYEIVRAWTRCERRGGDGLRASAVLEILTDAAAASPQLGG